MDNEKFKDLTSITLLLVLFLAIFGVLSMVHLHAISEALETMVSLMRK
jgi:hypothetical protein